MKRFQTGVEKQKLKKLRATHVLDVRLLLAPHEAKKTHKKKTNKNLTLKGKEEEEER